MNLYRRGNALKRGWKARYLWVLGLVVLLQGSLDPQDDEPRLFLSPEGYQAYELLRTTKSFGTDSLGFVGIPSDQVLAFRLLLRERAVDRAFKALEKQATLAGRLYGLTGLYLTDPVYFYLVAGPYLFRSEKIYLYSGCVPQEVAIGELAIDIFIG
jgi:hypothetical protein